MAESFFGLNIAVRGLFSAQRSLDITNHNLNNINTPGYSRQQAVQVASRPMALADGTGMMGTGSDVIGVKRIRDEYLDFKFWSENLSYSEWSVKNQVLADLEVMFNEPPTAVFTTIMSDFFDSLQELSRPEQCRRQVAGQAAGGDAGQVFQQPGDESRGCRKT